MSAAVELIGARQPPNTEHQNKKRDHGHAEEEKVNSPRH